MRFRILFNVVETAATGPADALRDTPEAEALDRTAGGGHTASRLFNGTGSD